MRQSVKDTKALAQKVKDTLPESLIQAKSPRSLQSGTSRRKTLSQEVKDQIEASYNQLDGEWQGWLEVAKRYEHKVPSQDRYDMRHTIILELNKARQRDGKPIPLLRAYRIASLTVALYWRYQLKAQVRVCVYDGVAKEPHCASCSHKEASGKRCVWLGLRPIQSLDDPTTDYEGNQARLMDTIADDHAIDLEAWQEAKTWLLGCPTRLIEIAIKKQDGIPLTGKDRKYLCKMLKRYQKPLF